MTSLNIAAGNPFRPADWRWQRAKEIVDGDGPATTRRRDEVVGYKWINRAVNFIRAYDECEQDSERAILAEQRPDIFWAHWAWVSTTSPQKDSIEAHILAREEDHEIAWRCGTKPDVITAYEALFFNVRDKLQHKQYILHCVMGEAVQRGLSEREYDLLWKMYGYFIGPYVLDALESKFSNPVWCGTPDGVGAAVLDDAVGTLKLKAALAAKTVQVNSHTQLALMDQFTKFVEVERNTDSAGKSQEQILDHISAMMTTLPFNVGGRVPEGNALIKTPVTDYDNTAVELTCEETIRLSVNQTIAHPDILKKLKFPVTESTQMVETE